MLVSEKVTCTLLLVLQNGYPARRRSLVDDARFETLVVKQTKQCVLEEARQRSNGKHSIFLINCATMLLSFFGILSKRRISGFGLMNN